MLLNLLATSCTPGAAHMYKYIDIQAEMIETYVRFLLSVYFYSHSLWKPYSGFFHNRVWVETPRVAESALTGEEVEEEEEKGGGRDGEEEEERDEKKDEEEMLWSPPLRPSVRRLHLIPSVNQLIFPPVRHVPRMTSLQRSEPVMKGASQVHS